MSREHGTYAKYKLDNCRCYPCAAKASEYNIARERAIAYGTWQPFVPAEPVRVHVRALSECGIGSRRLAVLAQVNRKVIQNLINGKPGCAPSRRIRPDKAARILSVEPTLDNIAPSTPVDASGARRRVQALVTIGWSRAKIAERLAMTTGNLCVTIERAQITAGKARAIRALYDELWDQPPPESDHREKISASRARSYARELGWLPPLAWDDDLIDLPDAELGQEIARRVALMDEAELRRCRDARYRLGEQSPPIVAAAKECDRRRHQTRKTAECAA